MYVCMYVIPLKQFSRMRATRHAHTTHYTTTYLPSISEKRMKYRDVSSPEFFRRSKYLVISKEIDYSVFSANYRSSELDFPQCNELGIVRRWNAKKIERKRIVEFVENIMCETSSVPNTVSRRWNPNTWNGVCFNVIDWVMGWNLVLWESFRKILLWIMFVIECDELVICIVYTFTFSLFRVAGLLCIAHACIIQMKL